MILNSDNQIYLCFMSQYRCIGYKFVRNNQIFRKDKISDNKTIKIFQEL